MTMIGADVEELQRLATSFGDGARELRELAAELTSGIEDAADWQGPDATRCKDEWGSFAQVQMTGVSDALETAARLLSDNAEEQERASGSETSGPSYGVLDWGLDAKTLLDFFKKPFDAVKKALLLKDFLKAVMMPATGFAGLVRAEKLLAALELMRNGKQATGLFAGAHNLMGKLSLPITIFSGLKDAFTGGGYDGWREAATRGFGLAGAAGAATLLLGGTALAVSAPITAAVAGGAVVVYGLWSAGNFVVDHWSSIDETAGRVWDGAKSGLEAAKSWARGLLSPTPQPAGA
ncbi:WXG100 family type VII secretion target [Nocardioides sp. 503]|uniref:WXG100 family type VII secretion target n=1 Tax=Nocardioides sp. 503 TaxID=2508326 RepID=UPI00106F9C2E|nr:WXG100 family type VII secretion target [Nocardioides sp. 503]